MRALIHISCVYPLVRPWPNTPNAELHVTIVARMGPSAVVQEFLWSRKATFEGFGTRLLHGVLL